MSCWCGAVAPTAAAVHAVEILGVDPRPTSDVVEQLYRWSDVDEVTPHVGTAAR